MDALAADVLSANKIVKPRMLPIVTMHSETRRLRIRFERREGKRIRFTPSSFTKAMGVGGGGYYSAGWEAQ